MEIEDLEEVSIRDEKCSMLTTENNIDEKSYDDNILNSLLTVFVENLDNNT
ncbi:7109_t:CDS:2 [Scutellospora calospora]|uniref:7109_t:CDS:1 n=1 Tax=Scutellospora calospora TaxID=85575 RepID=A0ACA9L489_9GLOM|nr:7109_t:CDS:2 [Scutellospora calospora]